MKTDAQRDATAHSCCGEHHHDRGDECRGRGVASARKEILLPDVQRRGERHAGQLCQVRHGAASAILLSSSRSKIIYTCPMHPQIQQDRPGNCPICGMTLEPKTIGVGDEEEQHEVKSLSRKFWIALVLTIPVLIIAMGHAIPGLHH